MFDHLKQLFVHDFGIAKVIHPQHRVILALKCQKNTSYINSRIVIKSCLYFMYYWYELGNAWVSWKKTWLVRHKKLITQKIMKQGIIDYPFKYFTKDRKWTNRTIFFIKVLSSFLCTGTTLAFFHISGNIPFFMIPQI